MKHDVTLALFDLDHTLLPLDSSQAWGHFMVRHGLVDAADFLSRLDRFQDDYLACRLDLDAYNRFIAAPLTRFGRAELDAWHRRFMRETIEPALRPAARQLVARHLAAGDLCCLVTATLDFITRPIAHALGIPHLLAIELATADGAASGPFTGDTVGVPTFREGKVIRTGQWLATQGLEWHRLAASHFYSDSFNDLPLLTQVSHPVAVNPDARLLAHASARGWPVLTLFDPPVTGQDGQRPC